MEKPRQAMKLVVFSFLYFASIVPVTVGVWQVLMFVEYKIGLRGYEPGVGLDDFTTLYINGDVAAAAAIFVIGGTVFASLDWGPVRLEGRSRPAFVEHFRHCALLYAFVVILGMMFAAEYMTNLVEDNPMYEVSLAVGIWLVAAFAVCVDVLVLVWQRGRFESTSLGDGA